MKTLYINGRFLGKPITGTQRYAHEIVREFDELLSRENIKLPVVQLVAPPGTSMPKGLKRIKFQIYGRLQGHPWEQWDLWRSTRDGVLLSLTNSGPVGHPEQLVLVHDMHVYRMPENYTLLFRLYYQNLFRILAKRASLATVTIFSRNEISKILGVRESSIPIISSGHEHVFGIKPDNKVHDKLGIKDQRYFLFVGSPSPSKNLRRTIEAFDTLQRRDIYFVIVGAGQTNIFTEHITDRSINVLTPGRLSDEEIVALYKNSEALVFPSLYEGFGIPPLEAMALGCPVIASNISPITEICGEAAKYFNPYDAKEIATCMNDVLNSSIDRKILIEKGLERCKAFTWKKSAQNLLKVLSEITEIKE